MTELNKKPAESLEQKWDDLGEGAHIGIYVAAAAVGAAAVAGFLFWCLRQRRQGRLEQALDDTRYTSERTEMESFQTDWKQSEWKHNGYSKVN